MDIRVLEETARLAHLATDRGELEKALPAFEQMLGFFEVMAGADTDPAFASDAAAGQTAGALLVDAGHFRGDEAPPDMNKNREGANAAALNDAVLGNTGQRDGRFMVIPNVL
jgi:aspartyl-tRNA(Asn)/glutamyl-tRNA(Gln) amidotransferase subunit C